MVTGSNARSGLPEAASAEDEGTAQGNKSDGAGIRVRLVKNGFNLWHGGSLLGTRRWTLWY